MFINYKNFENKNKNETCDIIKFINTIAGVDMINRARKLKCFSFKIDFNNISGMN